MNMSKNDVIFEPVKSSQLKEIGHRDDVLYVRFKNNKMYTYSPVSVEKFEEFKAAESIGTYFHINFKMNSELVCLHWHSDTAETNINPLKIENMSPVAPNETVIKALVDFGTAIKALKEGKRVQRTGWNGKGLFVFMQVPATINREIVPKMQSLPQSVKDEFERRFNDPNEQIDAIYYDNQLALVNPSNLITGWSPSTPDALAVDWVILD